jgi:hypothetical protein
MRLLSAGGYEFLNGQADVPGNLAKEGRGNVAALVDRDGCDTPV